MKVKVAIEGVSPILMNRFTDAAAASLPGGSQQGKTILRGNEGTPRDQAEPKVYLDLHGKACIPGPNIFACIIDAGKFHKTGKTKLTTQKSSLVPAGVMIEEVTCCLNQQKWEVDTRPVVIPATGGRVLCHRPRFDEWGLSFTLDIDTSMFDPKLVRQLVDDAGKKIGLGDFRPSRKGPFGRFVVTSWKEEKAKKQAA